jgi:hypothetical protein
MSYKITDYITTSGSGAKQAYLYAKKISSSWNVEYNKSADLLKTKKYMILDKTVFSTASEALRSVDYRKVTQLNFTEKIAACYILTDNRYLFVSFTKDKK